MNIPPEFSRIIPLLIPIAIIHLALLSVALYDWFHRPVTKGPKWVWLLVILFVTGGLGSLLYLIIGRSDEGQTPE